MVGIVSSLGKAFEWSIKLNAMRLIQQRTYEEMKRKLRLEQEKAKKVRVRVR